MFGFESLDCFVVSCIIMCSVFITISLLCCCMIYLCSPHTESVGEPKDMLSLLCRSPYYSWTHRKTFIDLIHIDQTLLCWHLNSCMFYSSDQELISSAVGLRVFRQPLAMSAVLGDDSVSLQERHRQPLAIWMVCSGLRNHRSSCTVEACVSHKSSLSLFFFNSSCDSKFQTSCVFSLLS